MDDTTSETSSGPSSKSGDAYRIGEDLYGLSLHELDARIAAYAAEIERLRTERDKKGRERHAADALFAPRSDTATD